jgi:pimeloyl-ACP methyl ester carboxylesterase
LYVVIIFTVGLTVTTTNWGLADAQQQNNETGGPQSIATNTTNATVVLVHGTAVDGSSWNKVIPILQNAGHKVIATQLPLHSLTDDVDTAKRAISLAGGPVTLVGHSYGGFVISNAAYNNPNVTGLVYLSAFAPNEGQTLGDFIDPAKLPKGLLVFDNGGFVYINPDLFPQVLAQDIDPAEVKVLAAAQKPYNQSILSETSGHLLGNSFRHGMECLRTTGLYPPMLNMRSQTKSMLMFNLSTLAMHHYYHIQMRLHN